MGLIDTVAQELPVKRGTPGQYVDGDWIPAATTDMVIKAAVQPAKPKELLAFAEGLRTRAAITLYCEEKLQTVNRKQKIPADIVTYMGEEYEVHQSQLSEGFGLAVWKAIAFLMDDEPEVL